MQHFKIFSVVFLILGVLELTSSMEKLKLESDSRQCLYYHQISWTRFKNRNSFLRAHCAPGRSLASSSLKNN